METTLSTETKADLQDQLTRFGFVTCPCCGWCGLSVTKAGKIRKHGRSQTGNDGLGCRGGGLSIR